MIPVTKETGACANFVLDSQDWYCMGNGVWKFWHEKTDSCQIECSNTTLFH